MHDVSDRPQHTVAHLVVDALRQDRGRHPVLPAGRPERRLLRRPVRRPRHPPDRHPPRAGRRLHGHRRGDRDRPPERVLRRARAGDAQRGRRADDGVLEQRRACSRSSARSSHARRVAGGVCCTSSPTRPRSCRSSPSSVELVVDPTLAGAQVQASIDAVVSGRPRPVAIEVAADRWSAPAEPVLVDPVASRPTRRRLAPSNAPRRSSLAPARPLIVVGGGAQDAGRCGRRPGDVAAGAGDDAPDGTRGDPDRPPAVRAAARRVRPVGRRRCRGRHRHPHGMADHALGHRRRAVDHQDRHRRRRARPSRRDGARHPRRRTRRLPRPRRSRSPARCTRPTAPPSSPIVAPRTSPRSTTSGRSSITSPRSATCCPTTVCSSRTSRRSASPPTSRSTSGDRARSCRPDRRERSGAGFATGVGAQAALPDRKVLVVAGDGGFLFTGQRVGDRRAARHPARDARVQRRRVRQREADPAATLRCRPHDRVRPPQPRLRRLRRELRRPRPARRRARRRAARRSNVPSRTAARSSSTSTAPPMPDPWPWIIRRRARGGAEPRWILGARRVTSVTSSHPVRPRRRTSARENPSPPSHRPLAPRAHRRIVRRR